MENSVSKMPLMRLAQPLKGSLPRWYSPCQCHLCDRSLELEGDGVGHNIVLRALEPVRQIVHNAGYEGSIVIDRLKNAEVGTVSMLQQVNG